MYVSHILVCVGVSVSLLSTPEICGLSDYWIRGCVLSLYSVGLGGLPFCSYTWKKAFGFVFFFFSLCFLTFSVHVKPYFIFH